MALGERDPHTGRMTTGHEWNGIKELATPVPKVVWISLLVTVVFSLVYWVLMPAWPIGVTYTKGLLGIDQHTMVRDSLARARLDRAAWSERIAAGSYDAIQADEDLMRIVRETGPRLFGDNCAVCHGVAGTGGKGYPNLSQASWIWGGDAETIAETLRVGINSDHPETRMAQMMAFGRDRIIGRDDVRNVVTYVQSLSDPSLAAKIDAEAVGAGATVFAEHCSACHGEAGKGDAGLGAPDLTDGFWIYGGDWETIYSSVYDGRQGHMPHWEGRLTPLERKLLTLYLLDLRAPVE